MTLFSVIVAMASATLRPVAPVSVGAVQLRDRSVRLRDAFELDAATPTALADRVIARLPMSIRSTTLSRIALISLARRVAPTLRFSAARPVGDVTFAVASTDAVAKCYSLARNVASGSPISADAVVGSPCRKDATALISYDRTGATVSADADLAAGAYLGAASFAEAPRIAKGDALVLLSRVGPVRVERRVVAMQPSRGIGRLFVRDADNAAYSVRIDSDRIAR